MTEKSRLERMVEVLLKKTKHKKADWGETDDDNNFYLALDNGAVLVGKSDFRPTWLDVLNANGVRLERLLEECSGQYPELAELYELARRQALEVDETIDALLEELGRE